MDGELEYAVKFPFTPAARRFMENLNVNERMVELAVERIKKAIRGDMGIKVMASDESKREDIASFAVSRMILGHLRNNFLTSRFAVVEAKVARNHLDHSDEVTVDLVANHFGLHPVQRLEISGSGASGVSGSSGSSSASGSVSYLDIPEYLQYSPRSTEYRLINRRILNNLVEVKPSEKRRLVEEAVRKHAERIPVVKDPPSLIIDAGKRLMAEMPKSETRVVMNVKDHPPCIAKLLESAKSHENLNHQARFYLGTYLIGIGMSEDDMTKIYSDMPDFSERTTRYQLSHLKKKGYSVPSCASVMTYGLCCAVCRIGSPLNWHTLSQHRKEEILQWKPKQEGQ